jgi:ABC-2 type transport system ATP-binding protein
MAKPSAAESRIPPPPIPNSAGTRTDATALRVDDLIKRYGKLEAVKGLSFQIDSGEIFGLIGPNGAGKTTAISAIATQLPPTGGDATVFGHSILTDVGAVREAIGLVPQEISLYPALSAAENVRFFGHMYGVDPQLLEPRVDELLQLVGLAGRRDDKTETFSGGMKRRLNLAVSLVHRPRVLLLDEPTVGVDPHSREHIFEIVRNLKRQGTAILYTTHYMEEAESLCDRLAVLDEGRVIATGMLEELLSGSGLTETIRIQGLTADEVSPGVASLPGVTNVDFDGDVCRLYVRNAAELLRPLQELIGSRTDRVSLQIAPMSLADLFLQLTGKELRD